MSSYRVIGTLFLSQTIAYTYRLHQFRRVARCARTESLRYSISTAEPNVSCLRYQPPNGGRQTYADGIHGGFERVPVPVWERRLNEFHTDAEHNGDTDCQRESMETVGLDRRNECIRECCREQRVSHSMRPRVATTM